MVKIRPLADYILVEPIEEESKTKAGIIIPETAEKEKPQKGKVIATGPGRLDENGKRIPLEVKKGDIVLFKKYAPDEIKINGKEYLVIKEEDIIAKVEEK
ncbi:co-chaperone GroES [bacterium]|nr:co-chaperone GroES [bacterium]